jgi:hypothetical protein
MIRLRSLLEQITTPDKRNTEFGNKLALTPKTTAPKWQVKQLFDSARTWPSEPADWNQIKPAAAAMHSAMAGGLTNVPKFMSSLKSIDSKAKLAALVKNFKYDGDDLFTWISGEIQLDWQKILNILNSNFKGETESGDPNFQIAQQIYLADRTLWDDEDSALTAIYKIKSSAIYDAVNRSLKKLSSDSSMTIGKFLRGFTKMNQRLDVFAHLSKILPKELKSIWIPDLIPWEDFKYLWTQNTRIPLYYRLGLGGESGLFNFNKYFQPETAQQSNAANELIKFYTLSDQWKNKDTAVTKELTHDVTAIATSIFDLAGPPGAVIAFLIMVFDAKLYVDQGNKQAAYMSLLFGMLGLGLNAAALGSAKNLTVTARKFSQAELIELGNRIARGETNFTREELEFLGEVLQYQPQLKQALKEPIEVWKTILSDPKLRAWKETLSPAEWMEYHRRIMTGELKINDIYKLIGGSKFDKFLIREPEFAKWFNTLDTKTQNMYRTQIASGKSTLEELKAVWRKATELSKTETISLDMLLAPGKGSFTNATTNNIIADLQEQLFFKIADELGLSVERIIGSGTQGYTFKTTSSKVIKISSNVNEISAALRARGRTAGKKHLSISNVYPLRVNGKTTQWYILEMDFLTTLSKEEQKWWSKYSGKFLNDGVNMSDKEFLRRVSATEDAAGLAFWKDLIKQRKDIVKNVEKMKLAKFEIHQGNVGFDKYGNITIFDYWTMKTSGTGRDWNVPKWAYQNSRPRNVEMAGAEWDKIMQIANNEVNITPPPVKPMRINKFGGIEF